MATSQRGHPAIQVERELGLFFGIVPYGLRTLLFLQVSVCLTVDSVWVVALSRADPLNSYT